MPKTLIYDCEIINDPVEYGWTNYKALGISVIGSWRNFPWPRYQAFRCDRLIDPTGFTILGNYRSLDFRDNPTYEFHQIPKGFRRVGLMLCGLQLRQIYSVRGENFEIWYGSREQVKHYRFLFRR